MLTIAVVCLKAQETYKNVDFSVSMRDSKGRLKAIIYFVKKGKD